MANTSKITALCAAFLALCAHSISSAEGGIHHDGFEPSAARQSHAIQVRLPDSYVLGTACGFLEYFHAHGADGGGITIGDCESVEVTPREPGGAPPIGGNHIVQVGSGVGFSGCNSWYSRRTMVSPDEFRTVIAFDCPNPPAE